MADVARQIRTTSDETEPTALLSEYKKLREQRERALLLKRRIDTASGELELYRESASSLTRALGETFASFPGITLAGDAVSDFEAAYALLSRRTWEFSTALGERDREAQALLKFKEENPELTDPYPELSIDELHRREADGEDAIGKIAKEKERVTETRANLLSEQARLEEIESKEGTLLGEEAMLSERLSELESIRF